MLKLIAILVLSGQLHIAVEQSGSYAEASFANSEVGAQQLIEFAENSLGDTPDGVRIVVGRIDDGVNDEHIVKALSALAIKHGVVGPDEVKAATSELQLTVPNARAVALADEKKFGFLYRRKR
jgi:hypothetical protein